MVDVVVAGQRLRALVDTGSSGTLLSAAVSPSLKYTGPSVNLELMDRRVVSTRGSITLPSIMYGGKELGPVEVHVLDAPPAGADIVIGLDVILRHGLVVNRVGNSLAAFGRSCTMFRWTREGCAQCFAAGRRGLYRAF